ncbi:VanZ family protein [Lacticaseibacillus brantae]|uniref:Glycopeptide antibiotics resistance protein n=1 Tax=Lacticaseibacillus brantae DSM 23927 TaxID=1423727 RepID=A0A0R2AV34_9LACO|nr:VanZ family protein [Lacticaseibacillus brantae]KRM71278.1 glycopeptide antibiotics resistance protein [Lacticaseibacillus brantae DSM 23927]
MNAYLGPIRTAIFAFPVLALVLTIPALIIQYRRYGSFIFWRAFVLYSFIFYLLTAYFLIILPLPDVATVAKFTGPKYNLVPFMALRQFIATTPFNLFQPGTWLKTVEAPAFIQPLFNLLLTVPFGVYLRYYFKRSLPQVIMLTFGLSLFFELTQLSGLYGIYPRPYRLFDVDDLIVNTAGGFLGGLIAPGLMRAFPTREAMDAESRQRGSQVTWTRRFVAFVIDYVLVAGVIAVVVTFVMQLLGLAAVMRQWRLDYIISTFITFVWVPYFSHGQTVGKRLVKIRLVTVDNHPVGFWRLVARETMIYGVAFPLSWVFSQQATVLASGTQTDITWALFLVSLVGMIFLFGNFVWEVVTRHGVFFYDEWLRTKQISVVNTVQKPV